MGKSYSKAPDETTDRVAHIIKLFYPELREAGVKVDLLSVVNDSEDKPALTHGGYAAAAVIRVVGIKERAKGAADVEITIDEVGYLRMNDAQKDALLDHELYHVVVKREKKTNRVALDCRGRPKIGMRKHDYQFGWFREIAERHGPASGEVQQATRLFLNEKQVLFEFAMGESTRLALEAACPDKPDSAQGGAQ